MYTESPPILTDTSPKPGHHPTKCLCNHPIYENNTSEFIRKILAPLDMRTSFHPTNTLWQVLVRPKDPVLKENRVIYQIPCSRCSQTYISQTGRILGQRLKEHQRAVRDRNTSISALADYVCSTGHQVDWNKAQILDSCPTHPSNSYWSHEWFRNTPQPWTESLDLYRLYINSFSDLHNHPPPSYACILLYSHVHYLMENYCLLVLIIIHALPHITLIFRHHRPSSLWHLPPHHLLSHHLLYNPHTHTL